MKKPLKIFLIYLLVLLERGGLVFAQEQYSLVILEASGGLCKSNGENSNQLLRDWFEQVVLDSIESANFKLGKLNIIKYEDFYEDDIRRNYERRILDIMERTTLICSRETISDYNQKYEVQRNDEGELRELKQNILRNPTIRFLQRIELSCTLNRNYVKLITSDVINYLRFETIHQLPLTSELNEKNLKREFWRLFKNTFAGPTKIDVVIPEPLWDDHLAHKDIYFKGDDVARVFGDSSEAYRKRYCWSLYKIDYTWKESTEHIGYHLPQNTAIRLTMCEIADRIKEHHLQIQNDNPDSSVATFENSLCSISAKFLARSNKREINLDNLGIVGDNYYYVIGTIYDGFAERQITAGKLLYVSHLRKYTNSFGASAIGATIKNKRYFSLITECYRQRNILLSKTVVGIRGSYIYSYFYSKDTSKTPLHSLVATAGPIIGASTGGVWSIEPQLGLGLSYQQKTFPVLFSQITLKTSIFSLYFRYQFRLDNSHITDIFFNGAIELSTGLFTKDKTRRVVILAPNILP